MTIHQRYYWRGESESEALGVLRNASARLHGSSNSKANTFVSDGECELLFKTKSELCKQVMPEIISTGDVAAEIQRISTDDIDELSNSIQLLLKEGATKKDKDKGYARLFLYYDWSPNGYDEEPVNVSSDFILLTWLEESHSQCGYLALGFGKAWRRQGVPNWFEYEMVLCRRCESMGLLVNEFTVSELGIASFTISHASISKISQSFKIPWSDTDRLVVHFPSVDALVDMIEPACQSGQAEGQGMARNETRLICSLRPDWEINRVGFLSKVREWLPEEWDEYILGMIYYTQTLDDLAFVRALVEHQNPDKNYGKYKDHVELHLGSFELTNPEDPHPDLNLMGHLKAVVTKESIDIALDMMMPGQLPQDVVDLFPGGIKEVLPGEVPGYKRGRKPRTAKKTGKKK